MWEGRPREFSKEEETKLVEALRNPELTDGDIQKKFGIGWSRLYRTRKKYNIPGKSKGHRSKRKFKLTDEEKKQIIKRHELGVSIIQICKEFDISPKTLRRLLHELKILPNKHKTKKYCGKIPPGTIINSDIEKQIINDHLKNPTNVETILNDYHISLKTLCHILLTYLNIPHSTLLLKSYDLKPYSKPVLINIIDSEKGEFKCETCSTNHIISFKQYKKNKFICPTCFPSGNYIGINDSHWKNILHNEKRRDNQFLFTIYDAWFLFIKQNKKCAICNTDLHINPLNKSKKNEYIKWTSVYTKHNASIDRKDSNKKICTINDVQWVCYDCQCSKNDFSPEKYNNHCINVATTIENIPDTLQNIKKDTKKREILLRELIEDPEFVNDFISIVNPQSDNIPRKEPVPRYWSCVAA